MNKKIINTPNAPAPIGPYNQAVETNGMLYISGQIALDPLNGNIIDDTIENETEQVLNNLYAILSAAGLTFDNVIKTSIFLSSMDHFTTVNTIYSKRFTTNFPARETVAVLGLPKGVNVEISMIAAV